MNFIFIYCTYCSMSPSLSTNTSMSNVSLFPSRTKRKHSKLEDKNKQTSLKIKTLKNGMLWSCYWHFWAFGLDWTSKTTVVTTSAYISLRGLAIHWGQSKCKGSNNKCSILYLDSGWKISTATGLIKKRSHIFAFLEFIPATVTDT